MVLQLKKIQKVPGQRVGVVLGLPKRIHAQRGIVCAAWAGRGGEQGLLRGAIAGQHIGHLTSKKTSMVTGSDWYAEVQCLILQTRSNIVDIWLHNTAN